ncbi:hypothetical protein J437_LFUL019099 [Ladona fulva]|uniref:PiggyBac transposable element-derived protein domain-containing protein n=1 Tax=Ladona fulva TaxID=123851 RepID=A0A8K0KQP3_LADFU|nr:hypothetical protein J437_LFUL019099 [Ladona fulva]
MDTDDKKKRNSEGIRNQKAEERRSGGIQERESDGAPVERQIRDVRTVEKRGKSLVKPAVVIDYNYTMGGVDRVDQHLSDYPLPRKRSKKYYKIIFFHLVELSVWNSLILYKKSGGRIVHLDYRIQLIEQLIEVYHPTLVSPRSGRPPAPQQLRRLIDRHFPDSLPLTEKKAAPTRQCFICCRKRDAKGKKIRRET